MIFIPYNYLLDDQSREGMNLSLENAIIIIDEAHNIKSFAEENSNFKISLDTLKSSLKELQWIEGSLRDDQACGPGIDISRMLVNHWINFIQHMKHTEGLIEITQQGFPQGSIVMQEKQIVQLI